MLNDKCIRMMRKTLFVILAMCSTLLVYAQEGIPVLPKKVKVGKPAILEQQPCKLEELKKEFCAERKWGTKKTVPEFWFVYSDRSYNVLYSDANKTRKLEATLAFKQELVIADVQGDMALVYEDRNRDGRVYPMIPQDQAKCLGWVPMDHLMLWDKCPTDRRGVQYKALISVNLNELKGDVYNFKDKYYEHPENDNNPKDLQMDMNFYFIMKESGGRALLAKRPTVDNGGGLYGWVDYSAFSRWDQRACLEPNWDPMFVEDHKGQDVGLYYDRDLTSRVTHWEYGKSNGDEDRWYEYRMDPAQFRFPILDKVGEGDKSIHCTAFSSVSGGKANYDEGNREVTEDVEQIRKMRGQMNLIFVVEATTEMNGIFPAIKESIKKCEAIAGQGLNVKVGAVLYRGDAQGASGIETVALTNYDDPLLNKKLEAKNANGKITGKDRDVALSLALEKAADAGAMGYNKDHNTLLLIVGSRGAPEDDMSFESSQLLDKLLENNVQVMSIQVVRNSTGSWVNFNDQMRTLIKNNVTCQYKAIGDKPKFNPTKGGDGYNFYSEKNRSDESVLFAEFRYSKELGKALSPTEVTSYIDSGINKFAEISEKWADHFEEALGDIEFDPQFLEHYLGADGYQQWKKVKAISALEGYTRFKDPNNQKYWNYILYLSGDELGGLINEMKLVYEAAKEGSGDRKPYINAMKAIIKSHLGQNDDKKIDNMDVEELQELLYGLNVHNDDREYNYTLKEIQDPRVVISSAYQTILDNFVKKYERLKEIQERYRYRVLLGKDYYYWIPIEYLPY